MRLRALFSLLSLSLTIAGCGGAASPTPAGATPPAATGEPPATPASPEASPTGADPSPSSCTPPELCNGELAPGEYASTSLPSTVRFTVGEGWASSEEIPDVGMELVRPDAGGPNALSIVAFTGEVFSAACNSAQATTRIGTEASDFISWLTEREGIQASEPEEVEVGGRPAVQVDLTTELPAECTDPPWIWLWTLPVVGDFHFNDQERARVVAVDAPGGTIVIVAEAFPEVDYEAFLTQAQALIDSIEIEA